MKGLSWAERDAISDVELFSHPSYENLLWDSRDRPPVHGGHRRIRRR